MRSVAMGFAAVAIAASSVSAVTIANGSLNGPTNTHSLIPAGWTDYNQGTTDTVSTAGHPFAASFSGIGQQPYGASPNGGTFCWSADFVNAAIPGTPEGLVQVVSGFSVGATYTLAFEYTNLGLYDSTGAIATNAFGAGQDYRSAGRWLVSVGGLNLPASNAVEPFQTPGTHVWSGYSQSFVANATTLELRFAADWVSGNGTHAGMGIDGITLVPEPTTLGLFAVMAGTGRRRR